MAAHEIWSWSMKLTAIWEGESQDRICCGIRLMLLDHFMDSHQLTDKLSQRSSVRTVSGSISTSTIASISSPSCLHTKSESLSQYHDSSRSHNTSKSPSHPIYCSMVPQGKAGSETLGQLLTPSCTLLFVGTVKAALESHTGNEFTDRTG